MKERILLLLLAVSSILVGCTESNSDEAFERPSEIPILLNVSGSFSADATVKESAPATRASINTIDDLEKVGIYCLAGRKTGINGSDQAKDPDWNVTLGSGANYATTTHGIYWNNLSCSVSSSVDGEKARLTVDAGQEYVWYYPITSWYAYDFYGYHPYDENVVKCKIQPYDNGKKHKIVADIVIDGKQDILWGRSVKKQVGVNDENDINKYAYSARYFRNSSETAVQMNFKHCLCMFEFYIQPQEKNETPDANLNSYKDLSVKKITMHRVKKNLTMTLADSGTEGGVGVVNPKNDGVVFDAVLCNRDGNEITPVPFWDEEKGFDEPVRVGDCIMVCPGEVAYNMSMVICHNDTNEEFYSEKEMTIKLANGALFEPGKKYKVYIKATGVTAIAVEAIVEDWEDYTKEDGELDENLNFDID